MHTKLYEYAIVVDITYPQKFYHIEINNHCNKTSKLLQNINIRKTWYNDKQK
ncbi:18263_t:CDS:2 [Gigaspora margarita]|uniref:18263_t:CDS:1 n=1 Tax=Gigaspora margarita TaxID=4874 RepID=A0ABN7V311_GIGMA|nr:18263_t:CDS:2 [Gigaspora margarita]